MVDGCCVLTLASDVPLPLLLNSMSLLPFTYFCQAARVMAVVASTSLPSTALETSKFLVECHSLLPQLTKHLRQHYIRK